MSRFFRSAIFPVMSFALAIENHLLTAPVQMDHPSEESRYWLQILPRLPTCRLAFRVLEGIRKLLQLDVTHAKRAPFLLPSRNRALDFV